MAPLAMPGQLINTIQGIHEYADPTPITSTQLHEQRITTIKGGGSIALGPVPLDHLCNTLSSPGLSQLPCDTATRV